VQLPGLGIPQNVCRADIVGMGCHAGMNSLKTSAAWAIANPGKYALACGVEVCSAQYVWGDETRHNFANVIVNSLFGDGCFAAVLRAAPEGEVQPPPAYLDMPPLWWTQMCVTGALDDMIYTTEVAEKNKCRFDLSELAPYHVGTGLFSMMGDAIEKRIPVHYADHVVTHTGGKTVLDCSAVALGLEGAPHDSLPCTVEALRDYGNQSSCSIMFAFDKLVKRGNVCDGDVGLFVTMGPGAGLEMALWTAGDRFQHSTQRCVKPVMDPHVAEIMVEEEEEECDFRHMVSASSDEEREEGRSKYQVATPPVAIDEITLFYARLKKLLSEAPEQLPEEQMNIIMSFKDSVFKETRQQKV